MGNTTPSKLFHGKSKLLKAFKIHECIPSAGHCILSKYVYMRKEKNLCTVHLPALICKFLSRIKKSSCILKFHNVTRLYHACYVTYSSVSGFDVNLYAINLHLCEYIIFKLYFQRNFWSRSFSPQLMRCYVICKRALSIYLISSDIHVDPILC